MAGQKKKKKTLNNGLKKKVKKKRKRKDLGEKMMTSVWNLMYWQDMLSFVVVYGKCEAGDIATHMEMITEIIK